MLTDEQIRKFVEESWRIEGLRISDEELSRHAHIHWVFLQTNAPPLLALEDAALAFTNGYAQLRREPYMNVQVGNHHPPRGGPQIPIRLGEILSLVTHNEITPYESHSRYETIHPFMDGNGRTGRMLWAWHMLRDGQDGYWPERGFLHTFYYQALQGGRG